MKKKVILAVFLAAAIMLSACTKKTDEYSNTEKSTGKQVATQTYDKDYGYAFTTVSPELPKRTEEGGWGLVDYSLYGKKIYYLAGYAEPGWQFASCLFLGCIDLETGETTTLVEDKTEKYGGQTTELCATEKALFYTRIVGDDNWIEKYDLKTGECDIIYDRPFTRSGGLDLVIEANNEYLVWYDPADAELTGWNICIYDVLEKEITRIEAEIVLDNPYSRLNINNGEIVFFCEDEKTGSRRGVIYSLTEKKEVESFPVDGEMEIALPTLSDRFVTWNNRYGSKAELHIYDRKSKQISSVGAAVFGYRLFSHNALGDRIVLNMNNSSVEIVNQDKLLYQPIYKTDNADQKIVMLKVFSSQRFAFEVQEGEKGTQIVVISKE